MSPYGRYITIVEIQDAFWQNTHTVNDIQLQHANCTSIEVKFLANVQNTSISNFDE